ncbi:MAG: site-specific recombinase [Candidatus Methanoperedens nitroreducens]|uniref:Site-specific recombinase n=1 Tax=Candidatus Methanoperedens nitratireducens TaxID=1392998 RepID=A0A0P8C649_9EURY|nr:MAG: site-specific recombinase [Candidatus Methanoperedens sp. BLZ1]
MFINGFTQDCKARGLTHHTIQTYKSCCTDFLERYPDPTVVRLDELRSYLGELRARGLQGSTLKGYFAALSSLYDYLVFEGIYDSNPIPGFNKRYLCRLKFQSGEENTRQLISIQDVSLLISNAGSIIDIALILFLAKTGMRRKELLSIQVSDLDFKNDIIRIPKTAKRSNRISFIDNELKSILEEYLSWRLEFAKSPWLWITSAGGRIHKDYPNEVLADLGAAIGLHTPGGPLADRLTCHCLRHFFTTSLFRAGMNPEYLKWLRGDSLRKEAWEIYNHIDPEMVRVDYISRIPKLLN